MCAMFVSYWPLCLVTLLPAAVLVLFLCSGPKIGFPPYRGDTLPDKCEIWHGGADRHPLPVPNFTFIGAEMSEYSPKTVNIFNFCH